ncbi:MAG: hypothetical protein J6J43_06380 [Oscillospiraceae bacterium]|nr:hypothetical protein [Oscillospiraceae bacterium]
MRRVLALLLAVLMVFSMAACGKDDSSLADRANKIGEIKTQAEQQKETQEKEHEKSEGNEGEWVDPEPSQGLAAYDDPSDHPHEGMDLTVFDGIYRAKLPQGEDEETWLQIKGYNDFVMLEYHGMMEGSVYRYWAEEFWPGEGWYTSTEKDTVSGKSQIFSSMAQYENYSELPQNRCITLTDDGVVLNYDDSDAEYFVRDDSFDGGHTEPKEMRIRLGEDVHLDFSYQYDSKDVVGTWGFWDGWQAVCLTFAEDGSFSMFWKEPNKPIAVYEGVYGFGRNSGNLVVHAERLGYGGYPYAADWEWYVDDYGYINISDNDMVIMAGIYNFWPVEDDFFTVLDADTALGYIVANLTDSGEYTDQYGGEYTYYYSLPQFYHSENQDLQKINEQITEFYYPIMETEQKAMEAGEILSYDLIDWQSSVYKGVLFLHVYAYTYDWEEHSIFYVDVDTLEQLDASEVLKRLEISEDAFLDAARTRAEEIFHYTFDELPEEDREAYGYYDCLEQTVSDEFVNLDLPIFVDRHGEITVYLKISHMAGSGLMWEANNIFGEFYGDYMEEAVG